MLLAARGERIPLEDPGCDWHLEEVLPDSLNTVKYLRGR